jgi:pantoate--beta-alanine ligase
MRIVTELNDWQCIRKQLANQSIGFVPTMGNLHAGHASLCQRSMRENAVTVVSIFVNPTQFNETSDYVSYPKTLDQDKEILSSLKVNYLFLPKAENIYSDQYQIQVTETEISQILEGKFRPGHFNGMLTVVLKLFHLIIPNRAYFGEKDYQQLLLVKKMVQSLFLPIEVIGSKTVRAEDGLALSSRNSRLTTDQRQLAAHFPKLLSSQLHSEEIKNSLEKLGFIVEYIADHWQRRLGAVRIDNIRLIDNVPLNIKGQ